MIKKTNGIWYLKNAYMPKNLGKVFSCFSCAGGSTMGYKLAGFDVIGNCEIDPKVAKLYIENHNPKYPFVCSIRDLIKSQSLPSELYNLDILDGSPPCTSFSLSGNREKDWGKVKKFSEGQSLQRLDDLFFEFIALGKRLQPKVIIAENVNGILTGTAKGYIKEINKSYDKANYNLQIFKLNGANMGIGQARGRVFFIAIRKDLFAKKLKLNFKEKQITLGQIEKQIFGIKDEFKKLTPNLFKYWKMSIPGNCLNKVHPKGNLFNYFRLSKNKPINTITASMALCHYKEPRFLSLNEVTAASSFPFDFNWLDWSFSKKWWAMGMSVPPFMMQRIALEVGDQWLWREEVN